MTLFINLALLLQSALGGTVMADGSPAVGAQLTFTSDSGVVVRSTTDESGHYMASLAPGIYRIDIERVMGKTKYTMSIPAYQVMDANETLMLNWPAGEDAERSDKVNRLYAQGSSALNSGDYDGAIDAFKQALDVDGAVAPSWASLSLAYAGKKQWDEAEAAQRMAIRFDPRRAAYHNNLGSILFKMGRFDEAAPHFSDAATLNPAGKGVYISNLAAARAAKGDTDGALSAYKDASSDPNMPASSWYYYGAMLMRSGRTDEGKSALQNYLRVAPDGAYAREARDMIGGR